MTDLLPCPLCGEKHISLNKPGFNYKKGSINCPACLLTLPGEVNEAELIRCWNDRCGDPAQAGKVPTEVWRSPASWKSPIETVADLVNNLLTLDQAMEVHGAYHIDFGEDRCRARGLSLSREHVTNGRIKPDETVPYSLVIWTGPEPSPAQSSWQPNLRNAPTEPGDFFLVRPRGLHSSRGKPFLPTIVQRIDGEFYTCDNEIDPVYFGQNEADDHPLKTTLEWQPLPADWCSVSSTPRQTAED